MRDGRRSLLPVLVVLLDSTWLPAQAPPPDPLRRLTEREIISEPGPTQPVSDSPAISTIISAEELWRSGCRSVAQALRLVSGFYGIDDHLGENIGVRGLNPGPRAYSRILKIMIDGQPVAFGPDATTFLGPELIPLEAVDHIEVSRGPASALYGADAFLGAVNIVTRGFSRGTHASVVARGLGHRGSGGELLAETGGIRWALLAAASHHELDRSGLALPRTSPVLGYASVPPESSGRDRAHPTSFFTKAEMRTEGGVRTEATFHLTRLSSDVAWADYTPLATDSTLRMRQSYLRILTEWPMGPDWALRAHATRSEGRPEAGERLASTEPTLRVRRDFGTTSLDLGLQARLVFGLQDSLTFGLDHVRDDHDLMRVIQEDLTTGTSQPLGAAPGSLRFENTGLYGQLRTRLGEHWNIDVNLREDRHGRYGNTFSHRVSLLRRFSEALYAKALHGSSYKAPSPYQLYAAPLYPAEIRGNADLKPERAKTSEFEFGWEPDHRIQARLRGFHIHVDGLIVLAPRGTPTPVNLGVQQSSGFEAELKALLGRHQWQAALTFQRSRGQEPRPFQGMVETPSSLYPQRLGTLQWTVQMTENASSTLEARAAGPRRASGSNILGNHERPYTLPGYLTLNGALHLTRGRWSLNLRVEDLLNRRWTEPGFRGYDVPSLGRTIQFTAGWRY